MRPTWTVARTVALGLGLLWLTACGALLHTPIATPTGAPLDPPPRPTRAAIAPPLITPAPVATLPTPTPTAAITATPAPTVDAPSVLLPTVTPTPTRTPTASSAWPATYRVQGTFVSQTRFPDGRVSSQQGTFGIVHQAAANAYAANQAYRLSTLRADGLIDTSAVYLVDDYIAVTLAEGDWAVLRRDQGSSLVAAIEPIVDLAAALPAVADQAADLGDAIRDGVPTRHIRITAADAGGRALVQSILSLSGEVRDLTLDAWIVPATAETGPYVAAYDFRVEVIGARVFDDNRQVIAADQTVSWSYAILDVNAPLTVAWPAGAPPPGVVDVPGFAVGEFPLPAQTELFTLVAEVPAFLSRRPVDEVASFYRAALPPLGWQVEGDTGLLRCTKGESAFQLLIQADPNAGGTRVTVLPAP